MKPTLLILAFFLAFLSCIPCTADGCAEEHREIATQTESHHDHPDDGACTPFCYDKCCANHVICEIFQQPVLAAESNDCVKNFPFLKQLRPQLHINIWQPPKV